MSNNSRPKSKAELTPAAQEIVELVVEACPLPARVQELGVVGVASAFTQGDLNMAEDYLRTVYGRNRAFVALTARGFDGISYFMDSSMPEALPPGKS